MNRTIATIQVRMGSQRLPGKTMRLVNGRPLLGHLLDRVRQAKGVDAVVVATPESSVNDVVEEFCKQEGVACFRGSEDDVALRMLGALSMMEATTCVEVYGDGPLIDPALIEECLQEYRTGKFDLVGNDMKGTYPSGMYNEVFSFSAFKDSVERCSDPAVREHGTLFLRQHPELYKTLNIEAQGPLCRPDVHLDVDQEEDFALIAAILEHFAPRNDFTLGEILAFLDANPELKESNSQVHRRWKQYQRTA